jgi:catechol 2,3-dioxygenase-like lactoylglutathione lyase family enzyme
MAPATRSRSGFVSFEGANGTFSDDSVEAFEQRTIRFMAVVGMANLAVKVIDLDAACEWYRAAGAEVSDPIEWENGRRSDVRLGWLNISLFTAAIYEDACRLPAEGFLHPALFVDDLDAELAKHDVLWGPRTVTGPFGTRRIAFVEAPGGIRLEFMEQLEQPGH